MIFLWFSYGIPMMNATNLMAMFSATCRNAPSGKWDMVPA